MVALHDTITCSQLLIIQTANLEAETATFLLAAWS
jgi:hypothetical protein